MCVAVVIPLRVGQSASSTSWYITHKILTYSCSSINDNLMTVISTQLPSFEPINHDYEPQQVPRRWPTSVLFCTKHICASVLKKTTQDIDTVSSLSAFTKDLAAVQGWKTKHNQSTVHSYTNIKLYATVLGVAKTRDQVRNSDSDIGSLILSLWHWVSNIESLTLGLWHWVSDIDWHWPDKYKSTDICQMLGDSSRDLLGLTPKAKLNGDDVHTMQRLLSCLQRSVNQMAMTTAKKAPPNPTSKSTTATNPTVKPATTSSPAPKFTSAPSLEHILVPPTTPINNHTADVHFGSTTPTISS